MATKRTTANSSGDMLYSFDAGNGTCKGISSARPELIQFAPVIAPMTQKRGVDEVKPTFSLRMRDDDSTLVFGVDDVFAYGKRNAIRRLNSVERYGDTDYFYLLDALFLQAFAAHRGNSEPITPTGIISVPISVYQDGKTLDTIRQTLASRYKSAPLTDYEGCVLRLRIDEKNLTIVPESTGAMTHYAFDPDTLRKRGEIQTAGVSLVIDIGYLTTDVSLFEGMAYRPDPSFTVDNAGMKQVTEAVKDAAARQLRDADISRVDRGLRLIAGTKLGAPKKVEVAPNMWFEAGEIYDYEIDLLANKIADEIRTRFSGGVNRAVLSGGGAYHLKNALIERLPFDVVVASDPDAANVLGAFTLLKIKREKGR